MTRMRVDSHITGNPGAACQRRAAADHSSEADVKHLDAMPAPQLGRLYIITRVGLVTFYYTIKKFILNSREK